MLEAPAASLSLISRGASSSVGLCSVKSSGAVFESTKGLRDSVSDPGSIKARPNWQRFGDAKRTVTNVLHTGCNVTVLT